MSQTTTRFGQRMRRFARRHFLHIPTLAGSIAQGTPPVRPVPLRRQHQPARFDRLNRQFQLCKDAFGGSNLSRAHLFEIKSSEAFLGGHGEGGVDFDLRPFFAGFRVFCLIQHPVQQRLGRAFFRGFGGALFLHTADRGQHCSHHVLEIPGIAPEQAEDLGKDGTLLGLADKTGMQSPIKILAAGEACGGHRPCRIQHPARPGRQPRLAQGAGEMGKVPDQFRIVRQSERRIVRHCRSRGRCPHTPGVFVDQKEASGGIETCAGLIKDALGLGAVQTGDVVLVFEDSAKGVGDHPGA